MFLMEYKKDAFVDLELVNWLELESNGLIRFTINGDPEAEFRVDQDMNQPFLNNLQAVNNGPAAFEVRNLEIIKGMKS